jgi:hypothetical protein
MKQLIETVENLRVRGIGFRSLTEALDTTTAQGRLVSHMFGALAEFERSLIRERTRAGLAAARRLGRTGGRPPKLTEDDLDVARALLANPDIGVTQIAHRLGVSPATLYRYIPAARTANLPDVRTVREPGRGSTGGRMENWTWGLSLTVLTIIVHATGIAFMSISARRIRDQMQSEGVRRHALTITIGLIGVVGLLLAALHGIEAGIWAAAYWRLGALPSPQEALLYSVDSITTRGASGLTLERGWRMMGALEAADGMLLFGISTAFIFSLMQLYAPLIYRHPPSN